MIPFILIGLHLAAMASAIDIKVGTVAPQGSPWDNALRELAARWYEITDGEITLKVYADGIVGDEPDLIRKMRLNQLSGAALTQLGLAEIDPAVLALSTPFLVAGSEEFTYLIETLHETYESRFADAGYIALSWGEAGWVRFFGTEAIQSPGDLSRLALAIPAGDDEMLQIWRSLGYPSFPLAMSDYAMGLQTGMVEAFYAPPAAVAAFGWYGRIGYMNELPVAPVVGAIVLTDRAWQRIPEHYRAELLATARAAGERITNESLKVETEAIRVMIDRGVERIEVDAVGEAAWRELGIAGGELAVGRLFSASDLALVTEALERFRNE